MIALIVSITIIPKGASTKKYNLFQLRNGKLLFWITLVLVLRQILYKTKVRCFINSPFSSYHSCFINMKECICFISLLCLTLALLSSYTCKIIWKRRKFPRVMSKFLFTFYCTETLMVTRGSVVFRMHLF